MPSPVLRHQQLPHSDSIHAILWLRSGLSFHTFAGFRDSGIKYTGSNVLSLRMSAVAEGRTMFIVAPSTDTSDDVSISWIFEPRFVLLKLLITDLKMAVKARTAFHLET